MFSQLMICSSSCSLQRVGCSLLGPSLVSETSLPLLCRCRPGRLRSDPPISFCCACSDYSCACSVCSRCCSAAQSRGAGSSLPRLSRCPAALRTRQRLGFTALSVVCGHNCQPLLGSWRFLAATGFRLASNATRTRPSWPWSPLRLFALSLSNLRARTHTRHVHTHVQVRTCASHAHGHRQSQPDFLPSYCAARTIINS